MRILDLCKFFCVVISDGPDKLFIVHFNIRYVKMRLRGKFIRVFLLCCCIFYLLAGQQLHVIIILVILHTSKTRYFETAAYNPIILTPNRSKCNFYITIILVYYVYLLCLNINNNCQFNIYYFYSIQIQFCAFCATNIILRLSITQNATHSLIFTIIYISRFYSHFKFINIQFNQPHVYSTLFYVFV